MTLKEQLNEDVKKAMRSGDREKRDTLRLLQAAIKQAEIDRQTTLDDAGVQAVLARQAKQRRESIADYEKAGRPEQAEAERRQLAIIESYLPQLMGRAEIEQLAAQVIAEVNASDVKEMGRVMGRLMPQLKGKADGRLVNEVVRELLRK